MNETYELYDTVDKEYILQRVSPEQVFSFYGYPPKIGRKYKSPFRKEDNASLAFHTHSSTGELCIKDFGNNFYGDFVQFVGKLFDLGFGEAVNKIAKDMNLATVPPTSAVRRIETYRKEKSPTGTKLYVKPRPFTQRDYNYWQQYGILREQLIKFKVFAVQELWINKLCRYTFKEDDPGYAYKFKDEYKIYFPFRKGLDKDSFLGNFTGLQGYDLLPEKGEMLCITKSYKDVMLFDRFKIPAIAPSAETNYIPDEKIIELKSRFDFVCSLYDFDYAGVTGANRLKRQHKIPAYFFTDGRFKSIPFKSKDLTDFYKDTNHARVEHILTTFKQSL